MRKKIVLTGVIVLLLHHLSVFAQPDRWQQRVKYTMDVRMDVQTNRFTGGQTLVYTNNSPDTLYKVFYHLYWNAFQPGSMMDNRSRELGKVLIGGGEGGGGPDWDFRGKESIQNLSPWGVGL